MSRLASLAALALVGLAGGCETEGGPAAPGPELPVDVQLRRSLAGWGVIPIGAVPAQDPTLVELGRLLMFDKILSGNRDIACATCHHPSQSLGDGLSLAVGTGGTGIGATRTPGAGRRFGPRNAPSLFNSAIGLFYIFWDGRLQGHGGHFAGPPDVTFPAGLPNALAAQAMLPVLSRQEMRGEPGDRDVLGNPNELAQLRDDQAADIWRALMTRLLGNAEYVARFRAAFPGTATGALGFEHAARALAAFQLSALTRTGSPFDRYLAREDGALGAAAKRGALLFFGEAGCGSCHNGPLLGGNNVANVGAPQLGPGSGAGAPLDFGFGELAGNEFYRFAFRVPPLRNVELTAPYTHAGAYATLEAVVRHYSDVPAAMSGYDASQLAPALRDSYHGDAATLAALRETLDFRFHTPLDLSDAEQADLVAFLKALTDPSARDLGALVPPSVPSGLPVDR